MIHIFQGLCEIPMKLYFIMYECDGLLNEICHGAFLSSAFFRYFQFHVILCFFCCAAFVRTNELSSCQLQMI